MVLPVHVHIHATQLRANQSLFYISLLWWYAMALLPHASMSDPLDHMHPVLLPWGYPQFQILEYKARCYICRANHADEAHHMDDHGLLPRRT